MLYYKSYILDIFVIPLKIVYTNIVFDTLTNFRYYFSLP